MTVGRFLMTLLGLGVAALLLVGVADLWLLPWIVHQQGEVLVPEVVGMPREQAMDRLAELGLRPVEGDEVRVSNAAPGTVIEQNPSPLRSVRRGRPVRILVSRSEARIEVPALVGLSLRQCEIALGSASLRLGRVARSFDPDGDLGVVGQRPRARSFVERGGTVDVLVREGHERIWHRVPDLVGSPLVRVREELTRARFEIRRVTYRDDRGALPGTVLDQWPPAGSRIPMGGSIELVAASR